MRIAVLAALASLVLAAAAGADPRPSSYVIPGAAVFPEGVAFQPSSGAFFVSSTGDGTIFRGRVSEPMTQIFLAGGQDGRTTAIGLEVDGTRLYVAGGATGRIFVYDTETRAKLASFETGAGGFLNDVATTKSGDAFVTDSARPILWRISADLTTVEPWLNLTGTPAAYTTGFNLNGIVATPDGKFLIVAKSNTSQLFRIDLETNEVVEITTDEPTGGDGLQLQGHTLYAIAGGAIVEARLSGDYSSGDVVSRTTDRSFRSPTTNAIARGRMLVVNSQFAQRPTGTQVLPFTISSVAIP
jgi:DNA-binding beta-propeller fold protein YncE